MLVGMIGNESRTAYMRAYLEKKGMEVVAIRNGNLEEIGSCGSLVFPTPVLTREGRIRGCGAEMTPQQIWSRSPRGCVMYGGRFPEEWRRYAARCGIRLVDFLKIKEVRRQNGAMTAQGCLMEAIHDSHASAACRKCLVIGYGCCGSQMADLLKGAGACVRVWDSDPAKRRQAVYDGHELWTPFEYGAGQGAPEGQSEPWTPQWIFHMADRRTIDGAFLRHCPKDCLIVDITTGGGCDMEESRRLGVRVLNCPGLPGKWMPRSGGELLGSVVVRGGECR